MPEPTIEIVAEGPKGWTLGYLLGYLRAVDLAAGVLDAEAEGFAVEALRERFRELLHPALDVLHLLVPASAAEGARAAIAAAAELDPSVTLVGERAIWGAKFSFSFRTSSREAAGRIRGFFDPLPPGVALSPETRFEESEHPENRGVDVYAPAHDFELVGTGTVAGELAGVTRVYRLCRAEDLVAVDPAELLPLPGA